MSRKAIPLAVARMRGRGDEAPEGELDPAHLAAAEEILGTLGELKGLALKVGQMMSYMDGALPAEAEPVFRRVLAKLQDQAPTMSWEAARAVLERELGDPEQHFSTIDEAPFAAASIGQVHRATLHDGTEVAVKIQYPGVRKSIEADTGNLYLLQGLAAPFMGLAGARGNMKVARETLDEIRDRLREEVDYTHEARMQLRFAEAFADDPEILVPRVYLEHCSGQVLVTEYLEGESLEDVADTTDQALRDQWARALTRAVTAQLYVHRLFNADPHPGNYRFRRDGTVVLLDFGCVKEIPLAMSEDMKGYVRAAIRATQTQDPADWAEFDRRLAAAVGFKQTDDEVFAFFKDLLLYVLQPLLRDAPFEFTREYTAGVNDLVVERKKELVFGKGRLPRIPELPEMPGDYTFINRLQWGFFSVLTRLRATVNWHALLPEAMRDMTHAPRSARR